jgi:ElaA protein
MTADGVRVAAFADLDTNTLYALLRLRVDVFVVEQRCPYPELDGRDTEPGTRHLWVDDPGGGPAAYLRVLADAGDVVRIGRVVVAKHARGGGHAARLMEAALELAGDRETVLDAQAYLARFYERYGFVATGSEYIEDGIAHIPMRRINNTP